MSRHALTLPISELASSEEILLLESYSTLLVSWFPRFHERSLYQCRVAVPAHASISLICNCDPYLFRPHS